MSEATNESHTYGLGSIFGGIAFVSGTSYPTVTDAQRHSHPTRKHGKLENLLEERNGCGVIVVVVVVFVPMVNVFLFIFRFARRLKQNFVHL
jgi:hypothetical protein